MEKEYEEARSNKRWDKKQERYVNRDGEPVVHLSEVVFDEVLAVIPLSGEYYSNVEKDKHYKKRLDKIIRNAMTSSLRKRDEERMKKNADELVNDLKKVAKEVKELKVEEKVVVNEQVEKKVVTEEQQVDEEKMMKKEEEEEEEEEEEVKEEVKEADQTQKEEKAEVPITEVNSNSEILNETVA
ncbi:hypothetical protein Hanom_Chr16g01449621 [Helianthus anomalus]